MGILRFRIAGKVSIVFGKSFIEFIRNQTSTKPLDVTYSNATGQSIVANQILYTYLNPSVDGYIEIKSLTNQVLNGSGVLNLSMTHRVSNTQSQQYLDFYYDSSLINVDVNYNSKPVADDITKDILNRQTYVFKSSDFVNAYNDYDNDALDKVSIYGNVTGYQVNSIQYVAGDWISLSDIDAGLFQYVSLNQDSYYEKDNIWKAMDINGNISE